MKKSVLRLFALISTIAVAALALWGCTLEPEDCYVFDDSEFTALRREDASLRDENAVRIMSANLLVHLESWGGEPVKPRAHKFAEAVKHYKPDMIGAQEMCSDWYRYLLPQLRDDYALIEPKNSVFLENRSPILYNKNKFSLVESDLIKYSKGDRNGCRVVTYGVFDRISDGKRLIVTSTHLDLIRMNDYEKEKEIILSQVSEFFETIDGLNEKYDCPIFMTGDYNAMERETSRYTGLENGAEYSKDADLTYYKTYGKLCGSFAYEAITERYADTKFIEGIDRKFDNTRGYRYDDPTWDHIFLANGDKAQILAFRALTSDYFHNNADGTNNVSDHLPIAVDALLK